MGTRVWSPSSCPTASSSKSQSPDVDARCLGGILSTYVLAHGSWHRSWCWDKVIALLEQAGHRAVAFDLPGHGTDPTPLTELSLGSYVDRACEVIDEQPEPVILVGHSMAGMYLSEASERCPQKIETLVYLCAFLLRNGESLYQLALEDDEALLPDRLIVSEEDGYYRVEEDAHQEVFYDDCSRGGRRAGKIVVSSRAARPGADTYCNHERAAWPDSARLYRMSGRPGDRSITSAKDARRVTVRAADHVGHEPFPVLLGIRGTRLASRLARPMSD